MVPEEKDVAVSAGESGEGLVDDLACIDGGGGGGKLFGAGGCGGVFVLAAAGGGAEVGLAGEAGRPVKPAAENGVCSERLCFW